MTFLLVVIFGLMFVYALYFAAQTARLGSKPVDFLNAGMALPSWSVMFLLPAIGVAALGLERQLLLVTRYGLQASHVAIGLVTVAVAGVLIWNRLWVATRLASLRTPGEALGRYYDSIALRVIMLGLCVLFALPYSAHILSQAAQLVETATGGTISRSMAVWIFAITLAIPAIIGGWRGTILVLAMQALFLAVLLPGITLFGEVVLGGDMFPARPMPTADGIFWDRIPGVLQAYGGVGKNVPIGGIFTTIAISSTAISLVGIMCSPATLYLGQTTKHGKAFAVGGVWLTGGLAAGLLLLVLPVVAARMPDGLASYADVLANIVPLAGVAVILLGVMGSLLAVSFFVTGGTLILFSELVHTYLFPAMSPAKQRFGARVGLGIAFFFLGLMAAFMPFVSAVFASVALPLALQLLPAIVGFGFMRWISRGAVLAGIALGSLMVIFTEPLGLILFEGLFVELPWGRWPLTIHSAGWGLTLNLLIVFLSSVATLKGPDRYQRDRFHNEMAAHPPTSMGRQGLLWALAILWGFLAYGPGAVLGNFFFSDPIFTDLKAILGVPSLWVWQSLFWLLGVVLVWWVAYGAGFGRTHVSERKPIRLGLPDAARSPDWIASGLKRVVNRSRGDEIDGDPLAAPVRVLRSDLETRPPSVKPGRGKIKFG